MSLAPLPGVQYGGEPYTDPLFPQAPAPSHQLGAQLGVTGYRPGVEEALGDAEVGLGGFAHLRKRAHAVVEGHRVVPDRVPEPVRHLRDTGPSIVHQ